MAGPRPRIGASDQAAVYAFETTVQLKQDYTADKSELNAAIDAITGAKPRPPNFILPGG